MKQKYKAIIEYCGENYAGMQKQQNLPTIQGAMEKALSALANSQVTINYCGRTDAGVHALGQVIDFEMTPKNPYTIVRGANFHLTNEQIVVTDVKEAEADFHSRFHCRRRYYIYKIIARKVPSCHFKKSHLVITYDINLEDMKKAAACLIGKNDFSSFRNFDCQGKSPVKTLDYISINTISNSFFQTEITIEIAAPSFLHNMVRNIVGTLLYVGKGKYSPEWVETVLAAKDRTVAGPTAPAHGLYFYKADY